MWKLHFPIYQCITIIVPFKCVLNVHTLQHSYSCSLTQLIADCSTSLLSRSSQLLKSWFLPADWEVSLALGSTCCAVCGHKNDCPGILLTSSSLIIVPYDGSNTWLDWVDGLKQWLTSTAGNCRVISVDSLCTKFWLCNGCWINAKPGVLTPTAWNLSQALSV